jgi:hypothetical protein
MFQWWPPPSSEKSTCTNQTTAIVSCLVLSYHAHSVIHFASQSAQNWLDTGVQVCSTPVAVKHHGNPESRSWHLHNIWHILVCVCVFILCKPCTCVYCLIDDDDNNNNNNNNVIDMLGTSNTGKLTLMLV